MVTDLSVSSISVLIRVRRESDRPIQGPEIDGRGSINTSDDMSGLAKRARLPVAVG